MPYTIQHNGKTFEASLLTQKKKDVFAETMKARAVATAVSARKYLADDEYQKHYDAAMDRVNSGAYDFHSEFTEKALKTPGGILLLSCVLFGVGEADMVELFRHHRDEVRATLDAVLRESNAQADPPGAA